MTGSVFTFNLQDAFPEGDPLAQWVFAIAAASNDAVFLRNQFEMYVRALEQGDQDEVTSGESAYILRLAMSHAFELSKLIVNPDGHIHDGAEKLRDKSFFGNEEYELAVQDIERVRNARERKDGLLY